MPKEHEDHAVGKDFYARDQQAKEALRQATRKTHGEMRHVHDTDHDETSPAPEDERHHA